MAKCIQSLTVWQGKIEQHNIKRLIAQNLCRNAKFFGMLPGKGCRGRFSKQAADQARITRVILNQQHMKCLIGHSMFMQQSSVLKTPFFPQWTLSIYTSFPLIWRRCRPTTNGGNLPCVGYG